LTDGAGLAAFAEAGLAVLAGAGLAPFAGAGFALALAGAGGAPLTGKETFFKLKAWIGPSEASSSPNCSSLISSS